jgi:hypothetical protein
MANPQAKGGAQRARKLTKEQRSDIARMGGLAKAAAEGRSITLFAKYGAEDRPLDIGGIKIPCYVLADGTRVLAQRGLQGGIGLGEGGGRGGARRIPALLEKLAEKGLDTKGLIARTSTPIRFIPPHGGNPAHGYEATILPDLCAILIDADRQGFLTQKALAERASILQHGFATVGIIALVDEATGYQDVRQRDALAKILERFVAKELRPWIKTFPAEYYEQIFRLNGWLYEANCGRPGVVGHWTNNIVYRRLAPGVLQELRRLSPRDEKGRLKNKLFQRLTDEVGHPKLREHLMGVVMLMKYAPNWQVFMERLDKEFPQWGDTYMLPFPEDYAPPPLDTQPAALPLG